MGFLDWLFPHKDQAPGPQPKKPASMGPIAPPSPRAPVDGDFSVQAILDSLKGGSRLLTYQFQHVALRESAFLNAPDFLADLRPEARRRFGMCHARATARLMRTGALDPHAAFDPQVIESEQRMLDSISVASHSRNGFTVHVIGMPEPREVTELYFAGVVHKDDEPREFMVPAPSTRYFTLEKAVGDETPFLCEWTQSGIHANCGQLRTKSADEFVESVFQRVLRR